VRWNWHCFDEVKLTLFRWGENVTVSTGWNYHWFDELKSPLFRWDEIDEIFSVPAHWNNHCFDELKLSLFRWGQISTDSMRRNAYFQQNHDFLIYYFNIYYFKIMWKRYLSCLKMSFYGFVILEMFYKHRKT